MSKKAGGRKKGADASGVVAANRQAGFKFELVDRYEAGIVLLGSEVKSLRAGEVTMKDAFASLENGELWLRNLHIAPYGPASLNNHEPERPRKLLLHRREIERLQGALSEKGLTLVPTKIYFQNGRAKIEIAVGRGKTGVDKREAIKEREMKREAQRAVTEHMRGR
jgi:SsrA-binding protein